MSTQQEQQEAADLRRMAVGTRRALDYLDAQIAEVRRGRPPEHPLDGLVSAVQQMVQSFTIAAESFATRHRAQVGAP